MPKPLKFCSPASTGLLEPLDSGQSAASQPLYCPVAPKPPPQVSRQVLSQPAAYATTRRRWWCRTRRDHLVRHRLRQRLHHRVPCRDPRFQPSANRLGVACWWRHARTPGTPAPLGDRVGRDASGPQRGMGAGVGEGGVDGTLATITRSPPATTRSVNVPPSSIATRMMPLDRYRMRTSSDGQRPATTGRPRGYQTRTVTHRRFARVRRVRLVPAIPPQNVAAR